MCGDIYSQKTNKDIWTDVVLKLLGTQLVKKDMKQSPHSTTGEHMWVESFNHQFTCQVIIFLNTIDF